MTIPKFGKYAIPGDSVKWESPPFTLTARIEHDEVTSPDDYACYGPEAIEAWKRDEWHYCGIVVSASVEGVELGSAALWGIELNFPGSDNGYLSEVAAEVSDEAIGYAKTMLAQLAKHAA